MNLRTNGIDVIYIDESERYPLFVTTAVRVPLLRPNGDTWRFVWNDYLDAAVSWRRDLSRTHTIRFREELHAYKLLRCQGQYHRTWRKLAPQEAVDTYRSALSTLTFLLPGSIMSAMATNQSELMGHKGINACLLGLFQRLRTQCDANQVNAFLFFDEGHDAYVRHFRRAQKYLPTGSAYRGWPNGRATQNMPLSMFPKDANFKRSHLSYFVQIADLVAYAARLKLEHERAALAAKRVRRNHHLVYDALPLAQINLAATRRRPDGIVPVWKKGRPRCIQGRPLYGPTHSHSHEDHGR